MDVRELFLCSVVVEGRVEKSEGLDVVRGVCGKGVNGCNATNTPATTVCYIRDVVGRELLYTVPPQSLHMFC